MIRNKTSMQQKEIKKVIIISIIATLVIIITNMISYNYLPEYIAVKSDGSSLMKKQLYVMILPCISIIMNFVNVKLNNRSKLNAILFNLLLPILNIYIIFVALRH